MLKKNITAKQVCNTLNELLKLDPKCAHDLVSYRTKCNKAVADHPTIQVQQFMVDKFPKIGIIGLINGMFGIRNDGMGAICFEIQNGKILRFIPTPKRRT
ncbi:MAG: hypothetical protein Q7R33_04715 [Nitrosarchaeum sp.]|nr:hypothetical protein [Nitrosarchaeum sp.]